MLFEILSSRNERSDSALLPSLEDYLSKNPADEDVSVSMLKKAIYVVEAYDADLPTRMPPIQATREFSSLAQFNISFGEKRYKLAKKKLSGEKLTAFEASELAQLNEAFRSLLTFEPSDDDKFMASFVKQYGFFDGEAKKNSRFSKERK